ncbi:MAG: hypothetical protein QM687_02225 [Ferruginibacter sp.]
MNGGILIIGSLLWDPDQGANKGARENWRKKKLNMDKKIHVFAPIRYGRQSNGSVSHTMVFSKEIETTGNLGTSFVVPFKNNPVSFVALLNQARELSKAEGSNDNKLVKGNRIKWCVIGILFNPVFDVEKKEVILLKFANRLSADGIEKHYKNFKVGEEDSVLKENGEMDIEWPQTVNPKYQERLNNIDFILATCPLPTVAVYPNSAAIQRGIEADDRDYFFNNIQYGITTFQDREIIL